MEAVLKRDGAVRGHMVERLAPDWSFREVNERTPIWEQFPLQCSVTGAFPLLGERRGMSP